MGTLMNHESSKVSSEHLERSAYIYGSSCEFVGVRSCRRLA